MIKEPKYYQNTDEINIAKVNYQLKDYYNYCVNLHSELQKIKEENEILKNEYQRMIRKTETHKEIVNKFLKNQKKRVVTIELIEEVNELRNQEKTLKEIGKLTDVSLSTVSRILNGYYDV